MNNTQATLIGFGVVAIIIAAGFWGLKRSLDRGVDRVDRTLSKVDRVLPRVPWA